MTATKNPAEDGVVNVLKALDAGRRIDKARLRDRIVALQDAYAADYDGKSLSIDSLAAIIDYLETSPAVPYPDLTVTPDGGMYAEWRGADGKKLAIEFMDQGEVRFLVLWPNPRHPHLTDRLWGRTTADALGLTMAPLAHLTGQAA